MRYGKHWISDRGAIINALAFSGSNFLFSTLFKKSIDKERTRIEWAKKRQELLYYINNEIMKEHKAEKGSQI